MKAWIWVLLLALVAPCAYALSDEEKEALDRAIAERGLNQYGDPQGTMYMGGTPLFDETTGQRIDRYDYIWRQHPELRGSVDREHPHGPYVAPPADRSRPPPADAPVRQFQ